MQIGKSVRRLVGNIVYEPIYETIYFLVRDSIGLSFHSEVWMSVRNLVKDSINVNQWK